MEFFDGNVAMGLPFNGGYQPAETADELLREMDNRGIQKALVWHCAQTNNFPGDGNRLLAEGIAGRERLWGCWTILPPVTGEVITPDFFAAMKRDRIAVLRAFPERHRFLLNRMVFGRFLDSAAERKIPLLLSLEKQSVSWRDVYQFLQEFPTVTCVLCDVGIWSAERYTWPLLESCPNVYLETSLVSLQQGGLEAGVRKFGARRFLFGTGFPERYPEAAMLQLLHADIPDADKKAVASGNLEHLLSQVRL